MSNDGRWAALVASNGEQHRNTMLRLGTLEQVMCEVWAALQGTEHERLVELTFAARGLMFDARMAAALSS